LRFISRMYCPLLTMHQPLGAMPSSTPAIPSVETLRRTDVTT
jgi:hypothetical protein